MNWRVWRPRSMRCSIGSRAAFRSQRQFIDDAGHELRTPITVIRGHLELLGDDPAERAEVRAIVIDELDRMSRMVNDLLLLARAERPDFLRLADVDIGACTGEVQVKGVRARRPRLARWRTSRRRRARRSSTAHASVDATRAERRAAHLVGRHDRTRLSRRTMARWSSGSATRGRACRSRTARRSSTTSPDRTTGPAAPNISGSACPSFVPSRRRTTAMSRSRPRGPAGRCSRSGSPCRPPTEAARDESHPDRRRRSRHRLVHRQGPHRRWPHRDSRQQTATKHWPQAARESST